MLSVGPVVLFLLYVSCVLSGDACVVFFFFFEQREAHEALNFYSAQLQITAWISPGELNFARLK